MHVLPFPPPKRLVITSRCVYRTIIPYLLKAVYSGPKLNRESGKGHFGKVQVDQRRQTDMHNAALSLLSHAPSIEI
jgi:hypothetical protein